MKPTSSGGPSATELAGLISVDSERREVRYREHVLQLDAGDPKKGLAKWLYGSVHAGNPDIFATSALLADHAFETSLRAKLPDPGVLVKTEPISSAAGPERSGVREIHRVRVAFADEELVDIDGDEYARISCLRPNLSPGFFMYVHDQGSALSHGEEVIRHYIGFTDADAAREFWTRTVDRLVDRRLAFRTKILSRRDAYPRNDALVYYTTSDTEPLRAVLTGLLASTRERVDGSPLCATVVPGLQTAPSPLYPGETGTEQSFGESRCSALAAGIATYISDGGTLIDRLVHSFLAGGIDPSDVSRNLAHAPADERRNG